MEKLRHVSSRRIKSEELRTDAKPNVILLETFYLRIKFTDHICNLIQNDCHKLAGSIRPLWFSRFEKPQVLTDTIKCQFNHFPLKWMFCRENELHFW